MPASHARPLLRRCRPALVVVLALTGLVGAHAERTDRNQPLNFAADSAKVDEAKQLNILSGNVEITKGTIVIKADRVEVRQGREGYQSAVATGWPERRATFRQKREGSDEVIEGEAERLEYDSRADTVKLVNRAVMRRYRGTTLADEVSGQTISYDNATEVFQVLGGGSAATPSGRVRGVLTPRSTASAASAPEAGR
ncbi:MAG TPA: lipopolysaccharide transport periplasmic protein LptA [Methylibium sp.]|nr:lipopolysaccharide transport periplasmic protein LptA [Methylibium sp.]